MTSTKLTPFEDLLHDLKTEKSSCGCNHEDQQYEGDSCPSDSESVISGSEGEQQFRVSGNTLIRICDGNKIYEIIKKKLESSLNHYGFDGQVETIHRNDYSDIMTRAKFQSFCIFSKAMEMKCGGNAHVKYAWYGASNNEINKILNHGFGLPSHGQGLYLSPVDHPVESMHLAAHDEDGLRHMLLCRVILGKTEVICPGSKQHNPSSEEFDSGVDNLVSPKKYIMWSSYMNTHILPEFLVSFRTSASCRGFQRSSRPPPRAPNSDWVPFATLISLLSNFLPPDGIKLITKHHSDYRKHKIARQEMIQRVRHIAGDKLLMTIIRSYGGKMKASRSSSLQQLKIR